jgi:hypothetical protein
VRDSVLESTTAVLGGAGRSHGKRCQPPRRRRCRRTRAPPSPRRAHAARPRPAVPRRKRPKPDAYLAGVADRKLKGALRHRERLYAESSKATARIGEWLAPADAGGLEAEGGQPGRGWVKAKGAGRLQGPWAAWWRLRRGR